MGLLYALVFAVVIIVILGWHPELETTAVTVKEKQEIQKNYRWLRTSSFLTVPSCLFLLIFFELFTSYRYELHYRVMAAVLPLVWHVRLIGRLRKANLFIFRHTQQVLALIVLRAALAAYAAVNIEAAGLWWFLIGNGFLWFFGTWWGNRQLKQNTCWLMTRKHEAIILAGDLRVPDEVKTAPESTSKKPEPVANPQMAQVYLDEGLHLSVAGNDKKGATRKLLLAFQAGSLDIRQRAVTALEKLGEVEKF